jgi:hypothetical protein
MHASDADEPSSNIVAIDQDRASGSERKGACIRETIECDSDVNTLHTCISSMVQMQSSCRCDSIFAMHFHRVSAHAN